MSIQNPMVDTMKRKLFILVFMCPLEWFAMVHSVIAIYHYRDCKFVTKWFIGLNFVKAEGMNVDLTYDIQSFTDTGEQKRCRNSVEKNVLCILYFYLIMTRWSQWQSA